jgi:hypothetical protein
MAGLSGFLKLDFWIFNLNTTSWAELTQNITGDSATASHSSYDSVRGYALSDGTLIIFGVSAGTLTGSGVFVLLFCSLHF